MKKFLAAGGVLGVVVSCLASLPAAAAPPEPATQTFTVDDCPFPLRVEVTGKTKVIEHGAQLITTGPGQKTTLTNANTGASISLNTAGAFHEQVQPNGDLVGTGTGHNIFAGPGVDGVIYMTGKVSYRVNAATGTLTITSAAARTLDVCSRLA